MSIEIERRFLIKSKKWENYIIKKIYIEQGYLNSSIENWIVRIRSENLRHKLTLKKHLSYSSCYEFEYDIPQEEGKIILSNIKNKIIKERFLLSIDEKIWVVDRFHSKNSPLEIAEFELSNINEKIKLPSFLAEEITGIKKYSNFNLSINPFSTWKKN
tara:strand:- start:2120 stop:2593 length:474 start_codon:yes stop_codon:yes gene_type:complete